MTEVSTREVYHRTLNFFSTNVVEGEFDYEQSLEAIHNLFYGFVTEEDVRMDLNHLVQAKRRHLYVAEMFSKAAKRAYSQEQ